MQYPPFLAPLYYLTSQIARNNVALFLIYKLDIYLLPVCGKMKKNLTRRPQT
jgi:hypothetical protein